MDKATIKMLSFRGKQADWQVWSEKFLTRARRKGFKDVLLGKVEVPPDSELLDLTVSKDEDKKKKKVQDANAFAYEALILLIDGETCGIYYSKKLQDKRISRR